MGHTEHDRVPGLHGFICYSFLTKQRGGVLPLTKTWCKRLCLRLMILILTFLSRRRDRRDRNDRSNRMPTRANGTRLKNSRLRTLSSISDRANNNVNMFKSIRLLRCLMVNINIIKGNAGRRYQRIVTNNSLYRNNTFRLRNIDSNRSSSLLSLLKHIRRMITKNSSTNSINGTHVNGHLINSFRRAIVEIRFLRQDIHDTKLPLTCRPRIDIRMTRNTTRRRIISIRINIRITNSTTRGRNIQNGLIGRRLHNNNHVSRSRTTCHYNGLSSIEARKISHTKRSIGTTLNNIHRVHRQFNSRHRFLVRYTGGDCDFRARAWIPFAALSTPLIEKNNHQVTN